MKNILKNYGFIICMLTGIIAGCITGAVWPGATVLEPIGTVFINLMFCIVVPMVFYSIASAIANMQSAKKAGKIMLSTVLTFCVTAGIAALIMYFIVRFFLYICLHHFQYILHIFLIISFHRNGIYLFKINI